MQPHRTPVDACSGCGQELDATRLPGNENFAPQPGDYSVCNYCATISQWDASMHRVPLTPLELQSLDEDERKMLRETQALVFGGR